WHTGEGLLVSRIGQRCWSVCSCSPPAPRPRRGATRGVEFRDSAGIILVSNPSTGLWSSDEVRRLEPDLSLGDVGAVPEVDFGSVAGLAVTSSGEIVVLDTQAGHLRLLSAEGEPLRIIGRSGFGPGELSLLAATALAGPGDTLYVPDLVQQQI